MSDGPSASGLGETEPVSGGGGLDPSGLQWQKLQEAHTSQGANTDQYQQGKSEGLTPGPSCQTKKR